MRFDAAYAVLFKCSRKRIADYPNLSSWLRDVYQMEVGPPGTMQVRAPGGQALTCSLRLLDQVLLKFWADQGHGEFLLVPGS